MRIPALDRKALAHEGIEFVEERGASYLLGGLVAVTGQIDRSTSFETGFPIHYARVEGRWQQDPRSCMPWSADSISPERSLSGSSRRQWLHSKELDPALIVPAHCTGWKAIHEIARELPQAFVPNSVGTRLML